MFRRKRFLISIALCLGTAALWYRTIHIADQLTLLTHADTQYELGTHPHGIDLTVTTHFRAHPPTWNPVSPYEDWREGWSYSQHPWGLVVAFSMPNGAAPGGAPLEHGRLYEWSSPEHYWLGAGYESTAESWTSLAGVPATRRTTIVAMPLWLIILVLALPIVPPGVRLVVRRRRLRANRCTSCGYDLRGAPGRCPECGAVAGGAKPNSAGVSGA